MSTFGVRLHVTPRRSKAPYTEAAERLLAPARFHSPFLIPCSLPICIFLPIKAWKLDGRAKLVTEVVEHTFGSAILEVLRKSPARPLSCGDVLPVVARPLLLAVMMRTLILEWHTPATHRCLPYSPRLRCRLAVCLELVSLTQLSRIARQNVLVHTAELAIAIAYEENTRLKENGIFKASRCTACTCMHAYPCLPLELRPWHCHSRAAHLRRKRCRCLLAATVPIIVAACHPATANRQPQQSPMPHRQR